MCWFGHRFSTMWMGRPMSWKLLLKQMLISTWWKLVCKICCKLFVVVFSLVNCCNHFIWFKAAGYLVRFVSWLHRGLGFFVDWEYYHPHFKFCEKLFTAFRYCLRVDPLMIFLHGDLEPWQVYNYNLLENKIRKKRTNLQQQTSELNTSKYKFSGVSG